jgi:hypothetical protein
MPSAGETTRKLQHFVCGAVSALILHLFHDGDQELLELLRIESDRLLVMTKGRWLPGALANARGSTTATA